MSWACPGQMWAKYRPRGWANMNFEFFSFLAVKSCPPNCRVVPCEVKAKNL